MNSEKPEVAADTNVLIVANNRESPQAGLACVLACIEKLEWIRSEGILLLDGERLILQEYQYYLNHSGMPGPGDRFFKWLWDNQANDRRCRTIDVTLDDEREFAEFPVDPDLRSFDRSDRKFVAVVVASKSGAEVINASDTDWWISREALQRNGIDVVFLCPELMREK